MTGTLTILNRVRERVVAGDWRNHLTSPDSWKDKVPGCILQLCVQEGDEFQVELYSALEAQGFESSIIVWNDAPGRTPEEVIALIDQAIAIAIKGEA